MISVVKWFNVFLVLNIASGTIDGLSYLNQVDFKKIEKVWPRGEDPSNPLYWYPRNIPEYCQIRNNPKFSSQPIQPGNPRLVPQPYPVPIPPQPMPTPPETLLPIPSTISIPIPSPPLPFGIPLATTNPMIPVAGIPFHSFPSPVQSTVSQYYFPTPQAGMVPGLPGLVTRDGGINLLPFSDAYSDLLERHKQRKITRRLQNFFEKYADYRERKHYWRY